MGKIEISARMMATCELSIVIVNFNTFELTCQLITSLNKYVKDVSFEIILVDNGSTKCDPKVFTEVFPSIILIRSQVNVGFAKGNNLGLEKCKGDYVLLLNSDTEFIQEGLSNLIDRLKKDNSIGFLTGKTIYPDGRIQHVCGRFPSLEVEIIELLRLQKLNPSGSWLLGSFFDHSGEMDCDWVWGSFLLFKRDLTDKFPEGKLHDQFFIYYEDVQWCYFVKRKLKRRIVYDPSFIIIHFVSSSSGFTGIMKKIELITRNESEFLISQKGWLYCVILYVLRGVKYFSLLSKSDFALGLFYLRVSKGILKRKFFSHFV